MSTLKLSLKERNLRKPYIVETVTNLKVLPSAMHIVNRYNFSTSPNLNEVLNSSRCNQFLCLREN